MMGGPSSGATLALASQGARWWEEWPPPPTHNTMGKNRKALVHSCPSLSLPLVAGAVWKDTQSGLALRLRLGWRI